MTSNAEQNKVKVEEQEERARNLKVQAAKEKEAADELQRQKIAEEAAR